jgi:hypothetical protein
MSLISSLLIACNDFIAHSKGIAVIPCARKNHGMLAALQV